MPAQVYQKYYDTIAAMMAETDVDIVSATVDDPVKGGDFTLTVRSGPIPLDNPNLNVLLYKSQVGANYYWQRIFDASTGVNIAWTDAKSNAVIGEATIDTANPDKLILISPASIVAQSPETRLISIGCGKTYTSGSPAVTVYRNLDTEIVSTSGANITIANTLNFIPTPASITRAIGSATNGNIPGGSYDYYVAAITPGASSATKKTTSALSVTAGQTVDISWASVPNITGYRVWRTAAGVSTGVYYDIPTHTLLTFTDTGAIPDGYGDPPLTNRVKVVFGNDDRQYLQQVLDLPYNVVIPATGRYLVGDGLTTNISNRIITAYGAAIIRTTFNLADQSFSVLKMEGTPPTDTALTGPIKNVTIEGGLWTNPLLLYYSVSGSFFDFAHCKDINVNNVHINGSTSMGIHIASCVNVVISNNTIENCARDAIYSTYSGLLKFTNNTLRNIKDDAMSIHDYGDNGPLRSLLREYGLQQAGTSIVSENIVQNTYQGFSSLGGKGIIIQNNQFINTHRAAIHFVNPMPRNSSSVPPHEYNNYMPGGTRITNIDIINNVCMNNCAPVVIMGVKYGTNGQNGAEFAGGRAAIVVATIGINFTPKSEPLYTFGDIAIRSFNINIENNKIYESWTNAVLAHNITGLTLSNNYAANCNAGNYNGAGGGHFVGTAYEVVNSTMVSLLHNSAVDSRLDYKATMGTIPTGKNKFIRKASTKYYPTPEFAAGTDNGKKILIAAAFNFILVPGQVPLIQPNELAESITTVASGSNTEVNLSINTANSSDDFINAPEQKGALVMYALYGTGSNIPLMRKCYSVQYSTGYMDFWYSNAWVDNAAGEVIGTPIDTYTAGTPRKVVKAASTINVPTLNGPMAVDGVGLVAGDLVLLTNQTTASQNGIYVIRTNNPWSRPLDASIGNQLFGMIVHVTNGSNAGKFENSNFNIPRVGTDAITFVSI